MRKSFLIFITCLLSLLIVKPASAQDIESDNHPMGYFAQAQTQEQSNSSTETAKNPSLRIFASTLAPDNLDSNDSSLPRHDVVDLASYQAWMTQADFNRLKALGVKTVVIKITEGTYYINPYAKQQITYAKNAGLNIAVYHFSSLNNAQNQSTANSAAIAEANYFAAEAKKLNLPTTTAMIMDNENSAVATTVDWTLASLAFAKQLNSSGYSNVRYYTSHSWATTSLAAYKGTPYYDASSPGHLSMEGDKLGIKNLWVAQYFYGKPSNANLHNTQFGAWQFTSQMYYNGMSAANPIDTSIDYANMFVASTPAPTPTPPGNIVIANGLYNLTSANRAIDISGAAVLNNSKIQSYAKNGTAAQIWQVTRLSTGYYTFMNPQSGKYLEAKGGGTSNGTLANLYQGNNTDAQQWSIDSNSSGGYSLINKKSGKALDIPGNSTANGAALQLYTVNNTPAQSWSFKATSTLTPLANGIYQIKNYSHNLVLDIYANHTANGTAIQLFSPNGTSAQKWQFTKLSNGNYEISNPNSGKSLDAAGAGLTNGTKVQLYQRNGTAAQQWIVVSTSSGFWIRNAASGNYLDVTAAKFVSGTPLQLYSGNGTAAQSWSFVKP